MNRSRIYKVFIASLLLLAVSTFSFEVALARAGSNPVERYQLKNGMTILLKEIPESPVVSVMMIYKVGSRNEKPGITGISHIVEHMVQKNTRQYPKGRMAELLNRVGADFNAFTSNDVTGFYETVAPEYLELALHIEADRMKNARITGPDLEVEKKVAISEAAGYKNNPSYMLWREVRAAAITHHPYRWPVQGYESDIKNLKLNQVKWYHKYHYQPRNAVLAIVGRFDKKKTRELIRKFFSGMKNGPSWSYLEIEEPDPIAEKKVIIQELGNSALLHIAYHSPSIKSRDIYAMAVIDSILVGGRSSRLRKSLIDTGLVSHVGAWLDTNVDPGLYYIRCTLKPGVKHEEVEKIIFREINRLKNEPISDEELQRAKNHLKADFIQAKDSVTSQAQYLAWYEAIDSYKYLKDYSRNIDRVTGGNIMQVATKYFTPGARTIGRSYPGVNMETQFENEDELIEGENRFTDADGKTPTLNFASHSTFCMSFLKGNPDGEALSGETFQVAAGREKKYFVPPSKNNSRKKSKPVKKSTSRKKPKPKSKPKPKPKSKPRKYKPPIPKPKPFNLKFKRHVLSNGMVLLIHENPMNPSVVIRGYIKAGGMYEPAEKAGLSKMTAFMLQRGSEGLNAGELSKQLDMLGAEIKFNSTLQNTEFSVWTLSEHFHKVVPLLSRVITKPTFPNEQVEKLRSLMLSKLESVEEKPIVISMKDFFARVYPENHPFHHFRWGTRESIKSISRDDLVKFYKKHYHPSTTIIAVSGDVSADGVIQMFEQEFSDWKGEGDLPQLVFPAVQLPEKSETVVNTMMDKSRVEIIMGHRGIPRNHPDFYRFNLMNYILGGAPLVSRLGRNIRDKGLCYKIYSRLDTSIGEGPWFVRMGVDRHNVVKAKSKVIAQIKALQKKPPTSSELENARNSLLGSLPVHLETNRNIAAILLTMEYYNLGKDYFKEYYDSYSSITAREIKEAAEKYLHPDKMTVIITGPYQ